MKIAISATAPALGAEVDLHFGRCECFLLVETDDMNFEVVANESESLAGGAGIQSARLLAKRGCQVVLTGNCGPNAHRTLTAAGIDVVVNCDGTVADAIARYQAGELSASREPNVTSHSGAGHRKRGAAVPGTSE